MSSAPLSERDREAILAAYPDNIAPAEALRRYRQWVEHGIEELETWLARECHIRDGV